MSLTLEYSLEAAVTPEFAWEYRTNVANWHDPPAEFALNGPFREGAVGTTHIPGQPPMHWQITRVRIGQSFMTTMELDRATLSFEWTFEPLPPERTKITQRIVLSGDNFKAYAAQVEAGFGPNLAGGMRKIVAGMERQSWA